MSRKAAPFRVRVVRYQLPNGKRCAKSHPRAVRVVSRSETYFGFVGGRRVPLGTRDLGEAWAELRVRGELRVSRIGARVVIRERELERFLDRATR